MIKLYILLGRKFRAINIWFFLMRDDRLNQQVGTITNQSAIYETEPWGFESDDIFWNQVLEISTGLSAEEVLTQTQQIENELGRTRKANRYDSRIIDIDILFFGNQIIQTENLVVPHPRIQERKFALVPLCEIVSGLIHPIFQKKS